MEKVKAPTYGEVEPNLMNEHVDHKLEVLFIIIILFDTVCFLGVVLVLYTFVEGLQSFLIGKIYESMIEFAIIFPKI